jgi:hypothetical protein
MVCAFSYVVRAVAYLRVVIGVVLVYEYFGHHVVRINKLK